MTEVIICPTCKGFGFTKDRIIEDYHKNEVIITSKKCFNCNGTGRLLKRITIGLMENYYKEVLTK